MNKRTITNLLVIALCLVSTMLVSRSGSARVATDTRLKQPEQQAFDQEATLAELRKQIAGKEQLVEPTVGAESL